MTSDSYIVRDLRSRGKIAALSEATNARRNKAGAKFANNSTDSRGISANCSPPRCDTLLSIGLHPECLKERQKRRQLTRIMGREETNLSRQFRVRRSSEIFREYFIDSSLFMNSFSLSVFSRLVLLYTSSRRETAREEMEGEQHRGKLRSLS